MLISLSSAKIKSTIISVDYNDLRSAFIHYTNRLIGMDSDAAMKLGLAPPARILLYLNQ